MMKKETSKAARSSDSRDGVRRRSFLKGIGMSGVALSTSALFARDADAQTGQSSKSLTPGDVAILRFLAAAELLETDLWQQYAELGGVTPGKFPANSSTRISPVAP